MKPHSSPWFSPACAAAIAHRNHYFHIFQHSDTDDNKRLFATARNNCKRVIQDAKSEYERNVHDRLTSQKIGSHDFWSIYNNI